MILIVMGVSGAGKTTIGRLLAERLGYDFIEGDDYHPGANVEKMRAGVPLSDADRGPWLDALRSQIDGWLATGRHVVLACSALKRVYRDRLLGGRRGICVVFLRAPAELIQSRLEARKGHFMPASLLNSQIEVLEPPTPEEHAVTVEVTGTPGEIVERLLPLLPP